jgi:hypothetical protein
MFKFDGDVQEVADNIQNKLWWLYHNKPKDKVTMAILIGYAASIRKQGGHFSELELFLIHVYGKSVNDTILKIKSYGGMFND